MPVPEAIRRLAFAAARRLPPGAVRAINLARGIDAPRPVDLPPGRRVAVVAPHPDDELVGVGGTLAKHRAAGHQVLVVMVTSGEASASFAGQDSDSARSQRESEALRALTEVGINGSDLVFLRIPEKSLTESDSTQSTPSQSNLPESAGAQSALPQSALPQSAPPQSAVARLAAALSGFRPDLVYSPSPGDAHAGHAAVARMVSAAVAGLDSVDHVALYEVMTPIYPSVVVDISAHIDDKRAGLGKYSSALASFDIVRIAESLSAYRSLHALHGRGYAEAFTLLRPSEFADLVARSN